MLDKPPPSRYKVIERDRRLVTIDTWSGEEAGMPATPSATPPPAGAPKVKSNVPASPVTPPKGPWGPRPTPLATTERQTRIIGLVFAAVAIGAVLILTGLWVPVGIALLIPQIRTPVWTVVKPALKRYLDGG